MHIKKKYMYNLYVHNIQKDTHRHAIGQAHYPNEYFTIPEGGRNYNIGHNSRLQWSHCFHFVTSDPVCEQADIGNGTTSWNSTLTSLEGDVTCDTDFMYTSVDTAVRCHDNGAWEPPIGQCLQYYWRNVSRSVYVSKSTDYSIVNARLSLLTAQNDGHC